MMGFLSSAWSYGLAALAGFVIGLWIGVINGKRLGRVDKSFEELRKAAENMRQRHD